MRVRLLGTAAGGGFPQWNCGCRNCRGVRAGTIAASARTQSSIAISGDGRRWFLVNASPDIRAQIESFPALLPASGTRGTNIEGILLTSADLDHTLGLLVLREGGPLVVHATPPVRRAVTEASGFERILSHYCGIEWLQPPAQLCDLHDSAGLPTGLKYQAFPVSGKPPRYAGSLAPAARDAAGYRFVDSVTEASVVCIPGIADLDAATMHQLSNCDLLLIDGTFWSEDEMARTGVGTTTALRMGHCPVGGHDGSLSRLAALAPGRRVYVHINNTNPMLVEDSPERRAVDTAGVIVGADGMEFQV